MARPSLGQEKYFSALSCCDLVLGNSSSGIIEAASFGKYVINLGDRQKGRSSGNNVFDINIDKRKILNAINEVSLLGEYGGENIYKGDELASNQIIKVLKAISWISKNTLFIKNQL